LQHSSAGGISLIFWLVSLGSLFDNCLLRTMHKTKWCVMSLKKDFITCGIVFLMVFLLPFMIPRVITSCHLKNRWFVTLPFGSCSILHSFLHSGGLCLIKRDHGSHVTNSSLAASSTKAAFNRSPLHFP